MVLNLPITMTHRYSRLIWQSQEANKREIQEIRILVYQLLAKNGMATPPCDDPSVGGSNPPLYFVTHEIGLGLYFVFHAIVLDFYIL